MSHRCSALSQEVAAPGIRGGTHGARPSQRVQGALSGLDRAEDDVVIHVDQTPAPHRLDYLGIEQLGLDTVQAYGQLMLEEREHMIGWKAQEKTCWPSSAPSTPVLYSFPREVTNRMPA